MSTLEGSPRFSVIVPTYNRADTIVRTLESLRRQQFSDFETIVVDDGSTDDTSDVVKRTDLDHLSYRWQPNAGPSVARNLGAELARGEYLVFLDTGDEPHPDWLATFDKMIRAYDCSVVSCGADFVRAGTVEYSVMPRKLGPAAAGVIALLGTGRFAVRRTLFSDVGGYDPALRFSESTELAMRLGPAIAGRPNAATHVSRSLLSIELPPGEGRGGRETSLAYSDKRRLETARHILHKHSSLMDATPRLRQTYLRVAGVASARLGDFAGARRYFVRAWRARPIDIRELLRAAVACLPLVRGRLWPPMG